ncbi:hypothetical protein E2320_020772 [Naja naja]|nr:hypothetical protein E2320_020772 [Naja naja]
MVEAEKHQNVVVYDQSTRDVNGLATDSFLCILLGKLDSCFHSVSILTESLTSRSQPLCGLKLTMFCRSLLNSHFAKHIINMGYSTFPECSRHVQLDGWR